jgi:beta-1,4-mannosyltransferase
MPGLASFPPPLPQNPYQRLLYTQTAAHGLGLVDGVHFKVWSLWRERRRVKALHFHWPQNYWRQASHPRGPITWAKLGLFAIRLTAARALGYRLAWTIHEVRPFTTDSPWVDHLGALMLTRACHTLIVNDEPTAAEARRLYRLATDLPRVIEHGPYTDAYRPGRPRAEVRAELGIADDAIVALCFGNVAPYKGIETVLEAFSAIDRPDAVLVFAGLVMAPELGQSLRAAARRDPRIRAVLEFVPDDRVAELYEAADLALCPRSDGGTSGALVLALSMGIPPVAADQPTYAELVDGGRAGWLFAPGDPVSLRETLEAALADPEGRRARAAAGLARAETLSWPRVGEQTAQLILGSDGHVNGSAT